MSVSRPFVLLALAVLPTTALGQLAEGDVLVNTANGIRVYNPDGTFVFETTGATGSDYWGVAFTRSGRLISAHNAPTRGLSFFGPGGAEVAHFATPEVVSPGDVDVFEDGTIVICDTTGGALEYYAPDGTHLQTHLLPSSGRPFGLRVTEDDELWVSDTVWRRMRRYTRDFTQLSEISTGSCPPSDIDIDDSGNLWTILGAVGPVRNYTPAGGLISSFSTGWSSGAVGCAVDMEGNIWVSHSISTAFRRYSPTGNILMGLTVPDGQNPRFIEIFEPTLAVPYCAPAVPNSTGLPARIEADGSPFVLDGSLTLTAFDLPPGEFGYFLVGSTQGAVTPPGSQGVLCLTCGFTGCSGIGRFNQAGRIIVGPTGSIDVDLGALPLFPPVAVAPGETWNFQCWFRDLGSNNFTDAVSVTFF